MKKIIIQRMVDMRGFIGIAISVLACSLAGCTPSFADVFKTEEAARSEDFKKAVAGDVHARYYQGSEDYQINSELTLGDHEPDGGESGGVFPKGYGTIDVNKHIYNDLINNGFLPDKASEISKNIDINGLEKLSYSNPVEADLLKHFHIAAILKEGIRAQQYVELQKTVNDPIYQLAARSQLRCVSNKLNVLNKKVPKVKDIFDKKENSKVKEITLDAAFDTCLNQEPFVEIAANDGMLLRSLLLDKYSKKNKDIINITGDVRLKVNDYDFIAPEKHIGNELVDNHNFYKEKIKNLLVKYRGRRGVVGGERDIAGKYIVDAGLLNDLKLPGFEVQAYQIRNLALLKADEAEIATAQLASRLAYIKTVQRFTKADEILRKGLENPRVEAAYKPFIQERREFLREELALLASQKELTRDFSKTMLEIVDQADQERIKTIRQMDQ